MIYLESPERRLGIACGGFLLAACAALWFFGVGQPSPPQERELIATTEPLTPAEQIETFHLPPGFQIELVASEPDVPKPVNLNFDTQGRLYVTCSVDYPLRKKGGDARDKLVVLSDEDGDGKFDRARAIVEALHIPIGVTPVAEGVVYHSVPNIHLWKGDPADDARQGTSEVLFGTFGSQDTHGMASSFTRWIDGWIYACHGVENVSKVKAADGRTLEIRGGKTFRMRPRDRQIEVVAGGPVNPFGLAFDPLGNLFVADSTTLPTWQVLRGASYPGVDSASADELGHAPEMMNHRHGSTGIAGIVYYAAEQFPREYHDTLFLGNPVTGRINHDRLERHGTTMLAIKQPDFLTCDDPWFRPVDLKLGPDGAIYVADFYNAVIAHVELPLTHPARDHQRGRIWRIRAVEVEEGRPSPMPREASQAELVAMLGDGNLTIRALATEELAARGWRPTSQELLSAAGPGSSEWRRAHLLWLFERTAPGGLSAELIEQLADDPARGVRVHLMKALAERPTWDGDDAQSAVGRIASLVRGKLSDDDPFVRRAAAVALARHPAIENIQPLLELWYQTPDDDTHLVHVVTMAVRDHFVFIPELYARLEKSITGDPRYEALLARASTGAPRAASATRQIEFDVWSSGAGAAAATAASPAVSGDDSARVIERRREAFLRASADPAAGLVVFQRSCAACHAASALDIAVGPALDGIGNRGLDRLLEDLLFPNKNISPEFKSSLVALVDGRVVVGRVAQQSNAGILLTDMGGKRVRLPADQIEQISPSPVSLMPGTVGESLSETDFNNLLSYLLAQRAK